MLDEALGRVRQAGVGDGLRRVGALSLAVTLQAALVVGHFAHGAHIYDDPSRYHVVAPVLVLLVTALSFAGVYAWRPSRAALSALVGAAGAPFVGVFGLYHGGFSHAAKLVLYAAGVPAERLVAVFDSPDFSMPNDAVFEVTGVLTLVVGGVIALLLARLVRAAGKG
jgi:hypothetical protein